MTIPVKRIENGREMIINVPKNWTIQEMDRIARIWNEHAEVEIQVHIKPKPTKNCLECEHFTRNTPKMPLCAKYADIDGKYLLKTDNDQIDGTPIPNCED